MTKKLLSALLGGGALAIAGLAALPMLATGADSANPGAATTAADAATDIVEIITPQITPAEELQATFSPAPSSSEQHEIDLKGTITVTFPADQEVTLTTDAALKPLFGQVLPLTELESSPEAVVGETNVWSVDLGGRVTAEGTYFLTLPAGMWTIDGEPSSEMTIYYYLEGRVDVVYNTNSGIYGANYTYTDEDGNVFGYYLDFTYRNEYRYEYDEDGNQTGSKNVYIYDVQNGSLRGVKTAKSSIKLPGHIYVTELPSNDRYTYGDAQEIGNRDYTMTAAEFRHDLLNEGVETSFPASGVADAKELKDVYVPASVGSVRWTGKFDTPTTNFHFRTPECPALSFDEYANGKVFIYAPDHYYYDYKEQVKDKYNFTVFVRSESPAAPVYINVSEPGTLAAELAASGAVLEEVRYVIVTGTPDETDLRFFRRLPNLEILDLGQTTGLTTVTGLNGLEYLQTVVLPETGEITSIGNSAFLNCISLQNINIPAGVTEIESYAFSNTKSLGKIILPSTTKRINSMAFGNSGLHTINLDMVEYIGSSAFSDTNVSVAVMPNIIELESGFSNYMEVLEWGDKLMSLGSYLFRGTGPGYEEIIIPNSLKSARENTFQLEKGVNKKITIESKVDISQLHRDFLQDIKTDTIIWKPLFCDYNIFGSDQRCLESAILYVPQLTYNDYLLSDIWAKCKDIRPLEDDLEEVVVDREFKLTSEKGIADKASLTVSMKVENGMLRDGAGHLTVKRKTDLNLGKYDMTGSSYGGSWYQDMEYGGATLIPNSTITADETTLNFYLQGNCWHFLTFPFVISKFKFLNFRQC